MTPMRMKLRLRRRGNEAAGAAGGGPPEEEEEVRRESGGRGRRKRNIRAAATAATPPSSPPSSSASARPVMSAEEASPDSKCPICLDRFNNLAYLDRCLHRFCFPCIQEWSHSKAECPLCKQPFASILHSVRAEDDFKEYTLRPAPNNSSVAATVAMVAAMASAARSNHQMRLMLRRHRGADGGEATRRERRGGRAGVWAWYVHSPPPPLPPPHPAAAEDGEEGGDLEEQRLRGGAGLTEYGVIFDGLREAVAPVPPNNRESRRLMTRLAERQQLQREGGGVRRLREREMVAFRRALYRCGVQVRGVAGVAHQGQQRDVTAESFQQSPAHLDRLRPWLQRELAVLYGSQGALVDIVQRIILARIARHGLEDMPAVEEELRPFLLARTEHFLHELVSYARSPLSLESYDLQAAYEPPAAGLQLQAMSSSSDSSSVIAISEGEEEEGRVGVRATARAPRRTGATHDDSAHTGSGLSLSAWDDETPGPSYSTAEPSCSLTSLAFSPAPQEPANEEGGEKQEEECLIVGYKKPIAERTPELVQLSSDPEDQDQDQEDQDQEEASNKLPIPLPPLAYTPTVPPSSSCSYGNGDAQQEAGGEAGRQRARSSSGGSGRSRNSVCSLSPPLGASEQRRQRERCRERRQSAGDAARRRRRCRRGRGRGGEGLRKTGTLYNPNRSIYPPMMRPPSPFHSSGESGSPLTPSPTHSSWEYHYPHTSPLTSSSSSTRSSSSSPQRWCQRPPPTSVSSGERTKDKPGGKRKYKSRHLDGNDKDPTWKPASGQRGEPWRRRRRRRREEGRRRGKQEEAWAADSRRRKEERSPSVEIIYEGTAPPGPAGPPPAKRCRRRQRRPPRSSPPVIITLDSDSSRDVIDASSSSPVSSQQTVDFSDLPPLPLSNACAGGGALNAEIGELPVEILDQGSTGSDTEPAGQSRAPSAVHSWDHSPIPDLPGGGEPGHAPGPLLDRRKGVGAGEENQDVPPLLKRASPIGSYDRNTPPLKPRDSGSPHGTSAPIGLCWPRTSADADPAASGARAGITISPALPTPPTKRPFASSPEPAASTPGSDARPSPGVDWQPGPPSAAPVSSVQSLSRMPPTDPFPGSKPADGLPHLDWTSLELHSGLHGTQTGSPVTSVSGGSGAAGPVPSRGCRSETFSPGPLRGALAWLRCPSSGPDSSRPADPLPEEAPPSAGRPEPTLAVGTGPCPAGRLTGGEGEGSQTGLKLSWDVGAQAADWSRRAARSEPAPEPPTADQCIRSSSQSESQWSAQAPLIDSGTSTEP